jgi:hypothetical protein
MECSESDVVYEKGGYDEEKGRKPDGLWAQASKQCAHRYAQILPRRVTSLLADALAYGLRVHLPYAKWQLVGCSSLPWELNGKGFGRRHF